MFRESQVWQGLRFRSPCMVLGSCTLFRMCPGLRVRRLFRTGEFIESGEIAPSFNRWSPCSCSPTLYATRLYQTKPMLVLLLQCRCRQDCGHGREIRNLLVRFHAHERCEALETVRRSTVGPVAAVFRRGHLHDSPAAASRCMASDTLVGPAPPPWTTCGSQLSLRQPTVNLEDDSKLDTPVIQHVGWGPMLHGASLVPCFVVDQSSERAVAAATKFFPDVGASLVPAVAAAANANSSTLRRQSVSAVAAQTRVLPVPVTQSPTTIDLVFSQQYRLHGRDVRH